jgi:hypothetical protein
VTGCTRVTIAGLLASWQRGAWPVRGIVVVSREEHRQACARPAAQRYRRRCRLGPRAGRTARADGRAPWWPGRPSPRPPGTSAGAPGGSPCPAPPRRAPPPGSGAAPEAGQRSRPDRRTARLNQSRGTGRHLRHTLITARSLCKRPSGRTRVPIAPIRRSGAKGHRDLVTPCSLHRTSLATRYPPNWRRYQADLMLRRADERGLSSGLCR